MDIAERLKRWLVGRDADAGLLLGVFENDPAVVSTWLARGANANLRDQREQTLLFLAVDRSKDQAIAKHLLARGADPRARDEFGQTPLHVAAAFGTEAHLRVLLDGGAEIDARDKTGCTPLHNAAGLTRFEEATLFVSRGADVALRDGAGHTPLDLARDNAFDEPLSEEHRVAFERLLGGFMTVRVVEAQPDALVVQVETLHSIFPEAEREAKAHGTLTIPCRVFHEAPEPGQLVRCQKGLSPGLDEAWSAARQKAELAIERER